MITTETLRALALFAGVEANILTHVAGRAADIRLRPGEYVIHEGEVPAFFVLLEGQLEVTKRVGGVERVIAVRSRAGDFAGETPLLLGAPAVANLRATVPSRVARIEGVDFQTLIAHSPELNARVMRALRNRVAGISELAEVAATQVSAAEVVIAGKHGDRQCFELRDFLSRNRITYDFLPLDDQLVPEHFPDIASYGDHCPIVRLRDGDVMIEPTIRAVAERIPSLSVAPKACDYDVTIVGAGPAGLAAAVYGASEGLSTLMIERVAPGGQAGTSSRIENYLGFPTGLSGDDLGHRALEQAKRFGAEIVVTRNVDLIRPGAAGEPHTVVLDHGEEVRSRAVVIAAGVVWRTLGVPSLERFLGGGVFYGAARSEVLEAQGNDVFLIGAGNSAGQAAMFFSSYAKSVTLVCRGPALEKSMSFYLIEELHTKDNVRILLDSEIVGAYGEGRLEEIDVRDGRAGTVMRAPAKAVFVLIGATAETDWLPQQIARDSDGYVFAGDDAARSTAAAARWPLVRPPYLLETTVPGIFAAGDVRHGSIKRVAASVGDGSMSIAFAHQYLAEQASIVQPAHQ